jgi:hypothetical protein
LQPAREKRQVLNKVFQEVSVDKKSYSEIKNPKNILRRGKEFLPLQPQREKGVTEG